ncbi:hypothetical protein D9M68_419820 [compost metagenome]
MTSRDAAVANRQSAVAHGKAAFSGEPNPIQFCSATDTYGVPVINIKCAVVDGGTAHTSETGAHIERAVADDAIAIVLETTARNIERAVFDKHRASHDADATSTGYGHVIKVQFRVCVGPDGVHQAGLNR